MKRFLSILLAIAMLLSLAPMAFAAEEPEFDVQEPGSTEGDDFDVGFGELVDPIPGATAENPITIAQKDWAIVEMGATAPISMTYTAEIPVGATRYFYVGADIAEYVLTIGEEAVELTGDPRQGYTFSYTNNDTENTAVVIGAVLPLGTLNNPEVIAEFAYTYTDVALAAGDSDGYYYTYTAPAEGIVTLYFASVPEEIVEDATYNEEGDELTPAVVEKYLCDIVVTKGYRTATLLQDGVDNYGLELQIPVVAGDVLTIQVIAAEDTEGNWYPEAEITWVGNFTYPAGSEQNPIIIEWTWDDTYTNATATVTVPEGATQYFVGQEGMILTANGVEVEQVMGNFSLTAGTYELALATPVGAQANPEVIENIDGYTDSNALEADKAYYYIWTATEDGTVTLDITDGANIIVDQIVEISEDGWPVSVQHELATATVDENWNYTGWEVAENLAIEVVAGQQLKIQVNGLTDWATWSTPAIEYTLTGAFEPAVVAPTYDSTLKFIGSTGLSFKDYIGMQSMMQMKVVNKFDHVYITAVQHTPDGDIVTDYEGVVYQNSYYVFDIPMLPRSMADMVDFTIYAEKDGVKYYGQSASTSVETLALEKIASYEKSGDLLICTLLVDMLNYGAAVQKTFTSYTNFPNMSEEFLAYAEKYATKETPTFAAENKTIGTVSIKPASMGISMGSKAEVQFLYSGKKVDNKGYEFRVTVDGETTVVPLVVAEGMDAYRLASYAVIARNMRKVHTFGLYDSATGEPVSAVYEITIEGYAGAQLGGKYNDVFIAMVTYGDAVAARYAS